ncbi:2TM domain-containing protein [Aphanothece hegewaldii]|nr:2TM domain-containing protein [Aphanothece hegewaldii]
MLYRSEEVQQILNIAIARQVTQGEMTRKQLLEIAAEMDIETKDLEAAEQEWYTQHLLDLKRQKFNLYQQEKFKNKAVRYVIINGFLMTFNIISAGTLSWAIYPIFFLGLPLSLTAWKTFQVKGEVYEQAFQRWQVKDEIKQSFFYIWTRIRRAWLT